MTDDLYRKEALEHRHRSLYGEVVLQSPPATWAITLLLLLVMAIIVGLLIFGKIHTDDGIVTLWRWLFLKAG